MEEKKIIIPKKLNEKNALLSSDEMVDFLNEPNILIDFSKLSFVWPFGTLILAEGIKKFVSYRKK